MTSLYTPFLEASPGVSVADRAVVVGINRYPGLTVLKGAENDAREFADWLQHPRGGRLSDRQIELILSSDFDITDDPLSAEPVVGTVDRAFRRLVTLGRPSDPGAKRRLTVFLAGHGFTGAQRYDAALLTAEATEGDAGYHVPGHRYAEYFAESGLFDEVILYMDTCADSRPTVPLRPIPWGPSGVPPKKGARTFYAFAAARGQLAREVYFSDLQRFHGVFSRAVLDGLAGRATQRDGRVTTLSLKSYLLDHLAPLGHSRVEPQQPHFASPDVVFELATDTPQPRVNVVLDYGGWPSLEVSNTETMEVFESIGHPPPWRSALPRGIYRVRETDRGYRKAVFEVHGDRSQTIDLEKLFNAGR